MMKNYNLYKRNAMKNASALTAQQRAVKRWIRPNYLGLSGEDLRTIPKPAQIVETPTAGLWYRLKKDETWYGVAKKAYGADNVKKGLLTINAATWNDHIDRKEKGWEAYKVKGLQATPDYSAMSPHSPKGSGSDYPTAWIPFLTAEEPEVFFPPPTPGERGERGERGEPGKPGESVRGPVGPAGPMGPPGPAASDDAIKRGINAWMETNKNQVRGPAGPAGPMGPPGTASEESTKALIEDYLKKHPIKEGTQGPQGPKGDRGESGTVSENTVRQMVEDYIKRNPIKGEKGDRGDKGEQGEPGRSGSGGDVSTGKNNLWVIPALGLLATVSK